MDLNVMFSNIQVSLDEEQEKRENIRTCVKDLEQVARTALGILQKVHQPHFHSQAKTLCKEAKEHFIEAKTFYSKLAELVSHDQFYRFNDHWRFVTQRLVFLVLFVTYLEKETLAGKADVANTLGLCANRNDGFHLELEDYLHGVLQLASELSRYATNSIIARDFSQPGKVSAFLATLAAGFQLLNLKNDGLRRRYDGLKWDVKKVEEVVYDLSLRNLIPAGGD